MKDAIPTTSCRKIMAAHGGAWPLALLAPSHLAAASMCFPISAMRHACILHILHACHV
jgi:hypothetical protein